MTVIQATMFIAVSYTHLDVYKRQGYRLARTPDQYTVGEILRITEGSLAPVACLDHDPNTCPMSDECITLPVWQGLNEVITKYLDSITIQDIIDHQAESIGNDYVI